MVLRVKPTLTPRWKTHPCILYQVCATRGGKYAVLWAIKNAGREPSWWWPYLSCIQSLPPSQFQLRRKVNYPWVPVNPLRREVGSVHGFVSDVQSYRQE